MEQPLVWREEEDQQFVQIRCSDFKRLKGLDEYLVRFDINEEKHLVFVAAQFFDKDSKALQGCVIADCGDSLFVDLPVEPLTFGSRILVPRAEQESVFVYY